MSLFFTKFYLSHKYKTLFLYMVFKHKVHKALINIIQLFLHFVKQNYAKNKKRTVLSVLRGCMKIFADRSMTKRGRPKVAHTSFFQTHYRSYSVMRFLSFIFIHIFIGDVHYIVKPEVFYGCCSCANAG